MIEADPNELAEGALEDTVEARRSRGCRTQQLR